MSKIGKEFKEFIMRGNVLDLAVGVIIGGAFGKIVSSLVNDVLMPVISLITGGKSLAGLFVPLAAMPENVTTLEAAKEAGIATLNYGMFIQAIIDFLIIALCIFLFVKAINHFRKKEAPAPAPAPRLCDFCRQPVADDATRCNHCTSELKAAKA